MGDIIENKIKRYTGMTFPSGPISASDVVSDKPNNVHKMLYESALNNLLYEIAEGIWNKGIDECGNNIERPFVLDGTYNKWLNYDGKQPSTTWFSPKWVNTSKERYIQNWIVNYKKTHKIIEIKQNDYLLPSSIICISNKYPYKKEKFSLTKYWDYSFVSYNHSTDNLLIPEEDKQYIEIVSINYVTGMCKLKSKISQNEYWVSFKYIDENTPVSETLKLENTFGYKFQNNKVG